ncbi:MAG: histidine phosphatase family protein, partial [bacterium]
SDLTPIALPDIFERMGLYESDEAGRLNGVEGPGRSYFESRFPHVRLPDELSDKGWWSRPVESDQDFFRRVESSLESIIDRHRSDEDRVIMVVHGDYIDQCINYLMGVPRKNENYQSPWVANWVLHNTSISRIDIKDDARNVVYLNRIDHLPSEHVTW